LTDLKSAIADGFDQNRSDSCGLPLFG